MGEAKRRKTLNSSTRHAMLRSLFDKHSIDASSPGFYDNPGFIQQEKRNPLFLENYAIWVRDQPYTVRYMKQVREVLPRFCTLIHKHLSTDALLGNCKQVNLAANRFLDRLGIWSYVAGGSLTVSLTNHPELGPRYLRLVDHLDDPCGITGHFWLVIPPFQCVDLTARLQRWDHRHFIEEIPSTVVIESATLFRAREVDIIGPGAGDNTIKKFQAAILDLPRFQRQGFSAFRAAVGNTELEYVPQGIVAANEPLEIIGSGGGFEALKIWNETIAPAFGAEKISHK
ncbi:hypothetical protein V6B08_15405 [Ferrovibrio sp. MS7]|uniref:hypothetical protein n=1 Tax=Ferrovibrio plantarum TaxID=3119164 RepID=UPI003134D271